jgi:single-stranded DNA-binding protein
VKAFGPGAETVGEHLHKGSRVYLEGRKRTESWDDKQTGAKYCRDLVYVDRIEFLDSKGRGMRKLRAAPTTRQQRRTKTCRSDERCRFVVSQSPSYRVQRTQS